MNVCLRLAALKRRTNYDYIYIHILVIMPRIQDSTINAVRTVLKRHVRVKLTGRGRFRGFCEYDSTAKKCVGSKLSGLTKRLESKVFSAAKLKHSHGRQIKRNAREKKRWKGKMAGMRRGADIDRELSKFANSRIGSIRSTRSFHRLTRLAIAAIHAYGLRIVSAQHGVYHPNRRVATAVDLICVRESEQGDSSFEIVLIEIKTGYDDHRMNSQGTRTTKQTMKAPLRTVEDSWCHRHMAQIASTWRMFVNDSELMNSLNVDANVTEVSAMILYLTEKDIEMIPLPEWWARISETLLDAL